MIDTVVSHSTLFAAHLWFSNTATAVAERMTNADQSNETSK